MRSNLFTVGILLAGMQLTFLFFSFALEVPGGQEGFPGMTSPKGDSKEEPLGKDKELQEKKPIPSPLLLVYKPPRRGAPGGRVGGGTRGIKDELITLYVLAPDHVGLTVQTQPTLYWYLSKLTQYPLEVTVIEDQAVYPILEKQIPLPAYPGIHPIRLADYDVQLSPGREYWWFVAVVPDAGHRSKDILAGGLVEHIKMPEALQAKLLHADKKEISQIYAEEGIWYDVLKEISDLIEAAPNNILLRRQRAALLEQVGLPEIAAHDASHEVPGEK
jgi:hypothetical protein